jgi:hypothetical protein
MSMAVHIDEISVQHLGPLPDFEMKLGKINLIYGLNESGKTYLVEFIIRSLFKPQPDWILRQTYASGRVLVSGLAEEPLIFTPASRRKLDDYWQKENLELPSNLSRLLVIKAGEVWLAKDDPAGVDYQVLKEYLSNSWIIDRIRESILVTTRNAEIVGHEIVGANQGDLKRRNEILAELEEVNRRIEQLNDGLDSGELAWINQQLQLKQAEFEAERRARRGAAYRFAQEMRQHENEIDNLPEEEIERISAKIQEYRFKKEQLDRTQQDYEKKKNQSSHYEWLKKAVEEYADRSAAVEAKPNWILPAGILAIFFCVLFLLYWQETLLTGLAVLLLIFLGWHYHQKMKSMVEWAVDIKHLEDVAREYEERIGEKMKDIATLKSKRDEQQRSSEFASEIEKDMFHMQVAMSQLEVDISGKIFQLTGKNVTAAEWEGEVFRLKQRLKDLQRDKTEKQLALSRLGIPPQDYLEEAANTLHDEETYHQLERQCRELTQQKDEIEKSLSDLKHSLAGYLNLDSPPAWEVLMEKLQQKRQEIAERYRTCTAKILAGVLVNEVLEQLALAEDERIQEGLRSPLVLHPLKTVTGWYDSLTLEEEQIIVSGNRGTFKLRDLSSGAQEQVLLALRIGFAAKHLGQEQMFLILDDAFQHADWQRRTLLLEQVVELARSGWQILYLTMDEHIRDLFKAGGGKHLVYKGLTPV